jgi:hypothetical protein
MQRVALVVAPLVLLLGCRVRNDQFCDNPANLGHPACQGIMPDGPPIDVSCKDDTGCTANPDQPVCKITGNTGVCVECTTDKATRCTDRGLICANDKCAPCARHADCTGSDVCKPDGTCALEADVAYVNGDMGTDQTICSKSMPCSNIELAAMTGRIVKVSGTVNDRTTLNNRNAVILADPGAKLSPSMDAVALEIRGNSQVEIYDLEISHPGDAMPNEGIIVDGRDAQLKLTRVNLINNKSDGTKIVAGRFTCTLCTIASNLNRGINATGGSITISQSTIRDNMGGGILIGADVTFQIVGNVIFHNGTPTSMTGGINVPQVNAAGTNRIDFNSISNNDAMMSLAPGINCPTPGPINAKYNIIWDNGAPPTYRDQVNIAGCAHNFSDIGPVPGSFGTTNKNADPLFMNEMQGDLRLRKPLEPQLFRTVTTDEIAGPAARDIENELRTADTEMGADHVSR